MPTSEDERNARILRLSTQRKNLIFALANADLSVEQRSMLLAHLSSVEHDLVMRTGGISAN
jgi:hypothetical protein